jgi:hypothetical protein
MSSVRRGRVNRRVARRARRATKKGYNRRTLPRSFPPSEATQRFTSTQSLGIAGHVNDNSHWQVFRFDGVLSGADDFGYFANTPGDNTGVGARLVTHSYRNWDLISPFYNRVYVPSCTVTLEFQSIKAMTSADSVNFNIYFWMSNGDAAAVDNTQPFTMPITTNTGGLPNDFDTATATTATLAALEASRRVTRVKSYKRGNNSYATIQVKIPNYYTRRGYRLDTHPKSQSSGNGGNASAPSQTIANALGLHYGFFNQLNVVCIAEHNDSTQPPGNKYFNHLRITKAFTAHFYERNETTD